LNKERRACQNKGPDEEGIVTLIDRNGRLRSTRQNKGPDEEGIVTSSIASAIATSVLVRIKAPMKRGLLPIILKTKVAKDMSE